MKKQTCIFTVATATLASCLILGGTALAAKGGIPGPPDNTGEEAGNNLSYPAVRVGDSSILSFFTVQGFEEGLGETWSYGCEGTEMLDDRFTYPNISCVDDLGAPTDYYSALECTVEGMPCAGKEVDRIYWQKEEDNNWSSEVTGVPLTGGSAPVKVRYVDWGDSIEVVNWNENSVLRVETQPFVDLSQDPLSENSGHPTQLGFQMWHVSGQGITEHWGVRVDEDVSGERGLPYAYQSPYAIINAGNADLYLSKLVTAAADDPAYECPAMGGDQPPVYPAAYPFQRTWTQGVGWEDACNLPVVSYVIEQSVSGKYVHGYNWRVRELANPLSCGEAWQKTGWWRLTYVPSGLDAKMLFFGGTGEEGGTVTSAPEIPPAVPTDIEALAVESEDGDETEGTLYAPVVDQANNLTYIDICIVKKEQGGGSGGNEGAGNGYGGKGSGGSSR